MRTRSKTAAGAAGERLPLQQDFAEEDRGHYDVDPALQGSSFRESRAATGRVCRSIGIGDGGPQLAWGEAKALAEQSRKMHGILKTATVGDVANLLLSGVNAGEQGV